MLHGNRTYLLQDELGQIRETHSIAAGLDYPGVGPNLAWLKTSGRAEYAAVTDAEALEGLRLLSESEGIIPALESRACGCARDAACAHDGARTEVMIANFSGAATRTCRPVARSAGGATLLERSRDGEETGGANRKTFAESCARVARRR